MNTFTLSTSKHKSFYKKVFTVAFPLLLQQAVGSVISLINGIILNSIHEVTAVNTATILSSLSLNITFGIACGMGVYLAQFFGSKDYIHQRQSFGLGLIVGLINSVIWFFIAFFFGKQIISFYINDPAVISSASRYLSWARYAYIPSSLSFIFVYTYRCIQKTTVPFVISFIQVATNTCISACLVYGFFGLPQLGIDGVGISYLISQSMTLVYYIGYSYYTKQTFVGTFSEMFHIDTSLSQKIIRRMIPTTWNELIFSFADSLYSKAFGILGALSLESYYIGNQIGNVFYCTLFAMMNTICVMMGEVLGSGDLIEAKEESKRFLKLSFVIASFTFLFSVLFSKPIVSLYNHQNPEVASTAVYIGIIFGLRYSLRIINANFISCLKAGGDVKILTVLDSGIMMTVGVPLAFITVHIPAFQNIAVAFLIIQIEHVVRMVLLIKRYKKEYWLQNLTI